MGTALRKLVKNDKNVSRGAKALSERRIKKMADNYRNAIMKHATISKDATVRHEAVAQIICKRTSELCYIMKIQRNNSTTGNILILHKTLKLSPGDSSCVWRINLTMYSEMDHLPAH